MEYQSLPHNQLGKFEFESIELREDLLLIKGLPLIIKHGKIGRIAVQVRTFPDYPTIYHHRRQSSISEEIPLRWILRTLLCISDYLSNNEICLKATERAIRKKKQNELNFFKQS